jgi:eukaryotic-like serine/threonine-protein kinase
MDRGHAMVAGGSTDVLPRSVMGFEVIDFIGEGAGSLLYAISHPQTAQLYALKHVTPKTDKDQRFVEQLETEFAVGQLVRHPGLRRAVEMKVNRTLFRKVTEAALLLELFDGTPLDRIPSPPTPAVVDVFIQVAEALDALHGIGYIHCDLKPNNILVGPEGDVKVIDLGQACPKGTAKSRIQGTPDYIAPEQVKCQPCSVQTDIYNFGATLYWALTGKNVPTLFTLKRTENSFLVDQQIASPIDLNPTVPEQLSKLVMECVKINPAKRPQGMRDIVLRLEIIRHVLKKKHSSSGTAMEPALV